MEDTKEKDLIILINDNSQDGIDVSWLWDVDFDRFQDAGIHSITVSGIRCRDYAASSQIRGYPVHSGAGY